MLNVDYQDYDTSTTRCPEENLWLTVLNIAVQDFKAGRGSAKFYFQTQAFNGLCLLLNLNPTAIRERLGILPSTYSKVDRPQKARKRKKKGNSPEYIREYMRKRRAVERGLLLPQQPARAAEPPGQAQPLTRMRLVDWYAMPFDLAEQAFPLLLDSVGLEQYETHCVSIGESTL